jgi:hypothetical protein
MEIVIPGRKKVNKEKLPQIIERIFSVCKADPNFPMKEKIEAVEDTLERLDKKILKQDELLSKGVEMHRDLIKKIDLLEKSNIETRERLLESLGSQL